MTKIKQGDLFIQSDTLCTCQQVQHALTELEYTEALHQASRIKDLILDHGWNLTYNYIHYLDKVEGNCNAWSVTNSPYLRMRGNFQEEVKAVTIPIERKYKL